MGAASICDSDDGITRPKYTLFQYTMANNTADCQSQLFGDEATDLAPAGSHVARLYLGVRGSANLNSKPKTSAFILHFHPFYLLPRTRLDGFISLFTGTARQNFLSTTLQECQHFISLIHLSFHTPQKSKMIAVIHLGFIRPCLRRHFYFVIRAK